MRTLLQGRQDRGVLYCTIVLRTFIPPNPKITNRFLLPVTTRSKNFTPTTNFHAVDTIFFYMRVLSFQRESTFAHVNFFFILTC